MMTSVQFSHSVISNSLQPHGLQLARPPCPSPTPRVYSDSCPLCRSCHPTISSCVVPFSSCLLLDRNLVVRSRHKKVKEGKRLIFPGLQSWPSRSGESARKREREKERRTRRPKSLVEQGCFIEFCVSIYTVIQGSFFR